MMKTIISLLFLTLYFSCFAQKHRFYYDYSFISDSTNKADVKKEIMLLDITKEGSRYFSEAQFVADSIMNSNIDKQIDFGGKSVKTSQRGNVFYKVQKNYPDFKVFLLTNLSSDRYRVVEDEKPVWKILPNKEIIGNYNAQKAETKFGGRSWVAWFSTDIPFQDGPYKFYGLPGLIVKIEDTTGSHSMVLKGNKKLPETSISNENSSLDKHVVNFYGNEIEITEKQFLKKWQDNNNDPTKSMRESLSKSLGDPNHTVRFKMINKDGSEITDPNQVMRAMEKRHKDYLIKNNNSIEPSLYK